VLSTGVESAVIHLAGRAPAKWNSLDAPLSLEKSSRCQKKTLMHMHRDGRSRRRASLAALAAAVPFCIDGVALAQPTPTPPPAPAEYTRILPYAKPDQLIDVGGRRINMHCSGTGTPTVVLMAGILSWSVVWYKTQPMMAQQTRVCAFDRAAYGFSDPAPKPEIISEVVEDLHQALHAGSIPEPYVLVGHSLGGLEARVYAQRWPDDVVGMVLVDTSPSGEGLIDEMQPDFDEATRRESTVSRLLHRASLANQGVLQRSDTELTDCSAVLPKDTPAAFREVWPRFFTASYFEAKASLFRGLYNHRYDSADHRRLGAMPLVVLSIEHPWDIPSPSGKRLSRSYGRTWNAMHADLAHLSSRGVHRVIR
jgi:pimeloyl-ACP methyl ester carboxylesterase